MDTLNSMKIAKNFVFAKNSMWRHFEKIGYGYTLYLLCNKPPSFQNALLLLNDVKIPKIYFPTENELSCTLSVGY